MFQGSDGGLWYDEHCTCSKCPFMFRCRERNGGRCVTDREANCFTHSTCEAVRAPSAKLLAQDVTFRTHAFAKGQKSSMAQWASAAQSESGIAVGSASTIYRAKSSIEDEENGRRVLLYSSLPAYLASFVIKNPTSAAGLWTSVKTA